METNMNYQLEPELAPTLTVLAAQAAATPAHVRGDWQSIRNTAAAGQAYMASISPASAGVSTTSFTTPTSDGLAELELRWYTHTGGRPAPPAGSAAVVYTHGGGMIGGSLDLYDELVSWYVCETGVPFLSVGLRLAPEATSSTTLAEDVYTGLTWLGAHAADLGADPDRIAVMGDSGGGGPTAAAAILARDRGVHVAKQLLIYPMLDDRNTSPGPIPTDMLTWTHDHNYTGWYTLLGDSIGTDTVSPIAAPARLTDHHGLAPAYIDVGDLDIFRDESIAYAADLAVAGVPLELHVHPGAPHGFERLVPNARVSRQAMADRARAVAAI
jgi:acetyl esterase/lipase